ncbi:hypothetical protein CK936_06545 [Streptomyces albireticuli]|uniref:Uncharacterized protein n=1 Tax=Streptomyces albireticuli TaxID=1940 RepID=A0A2A2DB40_9ACTN|nr:hypothetical protein CK936_06545 [Streptomyces albireticuli]
MHQMAVEAGELTGGCARCPPWSYPIGRCTATPDGRSGAGAVPRTVGRRMVVVPVLKGGG